MGQCVELVCFGAGRTICLFGFFFKQKTAYEIKECDWSSDVCSSDLESIAFGVGVTMPAIMILGFDLELSRVMLVAVLGGALGILMMIPLRRALIVKEHGTLKYPEGTACAEVLKAGACEESKAAASESAKREARGAAAAGLGQNIGAKMIFGGFGIGLAYNTLMKVFRAWKD